MLRRLSTVGVLFLLLMTSALAQLPGLGLPSGMKLPNIEYNPLLLINAAVQKELKLSPTAASKVQSAFMEEAMKLLPVVTGGSNGKPLPQAQRGKMMLAGVQKMQTRLASMLNPSQRTRLRQLTLQSIGPAAVLQPKVATQLGLSPTQKTRLQSSLSAANTKIASGSMQGSNPQDFQARMRQMAKLQAQAKVAGERALSATLTTPQKAKWRSMLGRPFRMDGFLGAGNTLPQMGG
jgi:hypothetical protein